MSTLSVEQKETFERDGYLVLPNTFSPTEVAELQAEADYLLEVMVNASLAQGRTSRRLDICTSEDGTQVVRKLQPVNDTSLRFSRLASDERVLGPLRELMGDEPVLMEEKLNYKQPLPTPVKALKTQPLNDSFPVHNDWAYYAEENYPQTTLSSAVLLDDFTPESGPLRMWPGTHRKHLEHEGEGNGLAVRPDLVDHAGGVDLIAPAGSFVVFSSLVVHNSRPNISGRPRRLMIYSHYPKSADMPPDIRNNGGRLNESPWEREYLRMKAEGRYTDTFHAPTYD
jgi:ectoine hydroxylase-related dioxygenase (phytanoyl-CoA dioxygenase family)